MSARGRAGRWLRTGTAAGCLIATASCVETRVIQKSKPLLAGLPGVQGGEAYGQAPPAQTTGVAGEGDGGRVQNPDGTVTLTTPTVRDLMRHILETITREEEELFTEQLLSSITRREFVERGYDPREAFRELVRRQDDLRNLFRAMPAGEFTPGILMRPVGRNIFRLRAEGDPDMRWSFMDVVFEDRRYTLRWFGR